jgi:hypothetical protein
MADLHFCLSILNEHGLSAEVSESALIGDALRLGPHGGTIFFSTEAAIWWFREYI